MSETLTPGQAANVIAAKYSNLLRELAIDLQNDIAAALREAVGVPSIQRIIAERNDAESRARKLAADLDAARQSLVLMADECRAAGFIIDCKGYAMSGVQDERRRTYEMTRNTAHLGGAWELANALQAAESAAKEGA